MLKSKNIKKLLSIALACVMLVVVSVSGVGSVAFADENEDNGLIIAPIINMTNENIFSDVFTDDKDD